MSELGIHSGLLMRHKPFHVEKKGGRSWPFRAQPERVQGTPWRKGHLLQTLRTLKPPAAHTEARLVRGEISVAVSTQYTRVLCHTRRGVLDPLNSKWDPSEGHVSTTGKRGSEGTHTSPPGL